MGQFPMFTPVATWSPPLVSELPKWPLHGRVCIDIETRDDSLKKLGPGFRRGAYIIGVAFAVEDVGSWYVPVRHSDDNIPNPEMFWRYLRAEAANFQGTLCGANLSYDLDGLSTLRKIEFPQVQWFRDPQIAEPLLDDLQKSYSLNAILRRHGLAPKDEILLEEAADAYHIPRKQIKAALWQLPARFVGPYATRDVEAPLQLLRRQERAIDEQGLWGIYNLESKVLPITCRLRQRGIRVDFDKLDQVDRYAQMEGDRVLTEVYHYTGCRLRLDEVNNKNALAKPLTAVGTELAKDRNGQPIVDKQLLESIPHKIGALLRRAKQMNKLITTFSASVRAHAVNGRIHSTFNQLRHQREDGGEQGAAYGRMSCTDPNLQQQPSRDDFAALWRSIYVPDEGGLWASCDYSQQEPRWLTHFAAECRPYARNFRNISLAKADIAAKRYCDDPNTDNHTMMARILSPEFDTYDKAKQKEIRGNAKIIFLGICYGMGGGKLCRGLGFPTKHIWSDRLGKVIEIAGDEGKAVMDLFHERLPFVRGMASLCEQVVQERGYIRTIGGRLCRFPTKPDGTCDWTHKALNRLIQGSSADQTKAAMVAVEEAGFRLQLQVHDELDLTVESKTQAEEVAEIMTTVFPARVPFRVDVEIGPSWGEAK